MRQLVILSTVICMAFSSFAQTVERDSSITVSSSRLHRLEQLLVVSLQVDVNRHLSPNESVVLKPQLADTLGNFIQLPSIYINGWKQHIMFQREPSHQKNNDEALKRRNGELQQLRYLRSIPFSSWMNRAELTLVEEECGCGVPRSSESVWTTRMPERTSIHPHVAFITPQVEERKIRTVSGSAFLDFPLNEITIYPYYRNNLAELAKIEQSIEVIHNDSNVVITAIDIHGYASPEGPYDNNERLARERTETLKKYVCSRYPFCDDIMTTQYTPEDWDGFVIQLADSTMAHSDELLKIVDSNDKPDAKEAKMRKNYPEEFEHILKHWFPALRHSDYTIHYEVRPFTVEQAKQVFAEHPKNLSIEEMFRIAQTYEVGSPEYNLVFMKAVELNPDNGVANLNAACIALRQGDIVSGKRYLEKAVDSPEKVLLQGVIHMFQGEYDEAGNKFREAEEAGLAEATENLKLLEELF